MKELSEKEMNRLREIQIDMLNDINDIFKKNNIRYIAMFGTFLGSIRHQGFIPWDDDIDIGIPRKDYDYLIENFEKIFPSDYALLTPDNCQHFEFFFSKIHKKNTTFIEEGLGGFPDRRTGVFIDIFPLDGAPNDVSEQKKYNTTINNLMKLNIKIRFNSSFGKTKKSKLFFMLFAPLRVLLPYNYYYMKYLRYVSKYDFETSKYFSYPSTVHSYNTIFDKKIVSSIIPRKFEDTYIMTAADADSMLRQTFGDYLTLPPEEQHIPKHVVDYVSFDEPFESYNE